MEKTTVTTIAMKSIATTSATLPHNSVANPVANVWTLSINVIAFGIVVTEPMKKTVFKILTTKRKCRLSDVIPMNSSADLVIVLTIISFATERRMEAMKCHVIQRQFICVTKQLNSSAGLQVIVYLLNVNVIHIWIVRTIPMKAIAVLLRIATVSHQKTTKQYVYEYPGSATIRSTV